MQRHWNEELQSCREFPHASPQESTPAELLDGDLKSLGGLFDVLMTWLSAARTFQQTCIDSNQDNVVGYLQKSSDVISNSLAIIKGFSRVTNSNNQRRRLMSLVERCAHFFGTSMEELFDHILP
ncbi:putative invertase/pectin methylesterase inhibitor domain superfamily [Helianthus debilis subsp. tardiflorus]